MLERLAGLERNYQELETQMASPELAADIEQLQKLTRERAGLESLVNNYREYQKTVKILGETRTMLDDGPGEEMMALVKQEILDLESKKDDLLEDLKRALLPKDPNDDKNIIMEVRAGAGGDEAGLFAADLFRMYSRYAEVRGWGVEIISQSESGIGGFKEIIFEVKGRGAFSRFKYERGVHRVQRVPATESSGRIHTSTATVAVLPEADEIDVSIGADDLRIDIYHSGGAGGQNVNKVATAVRITHLPTGIVVVCQDERSQLKNRTKAMSVLRARLLDMEQRKQELEITSQRRSQVGTGDRAEKIRTYNFPQDRITDHRIGITVRNLPRVLDGDLEELIDTIATTDRAKQLEAQLA